MLTVLKLFSGSLLILRSSASNVYWDNSLSPKMRCVFTSVRASDAGLWEAFLPCVCVCVCVIKLMVPYISLRDIGTYVIKVTEFNFKARCGLQGRFEVAVASEVGIAKSSLSLRLELSSFSTLRLSSRGEPQSPITSILAGFE